MSPVGEDRRRRPVAFFCMAERGHFQRLRPLIHGVAQAGMVAHVFTAADFRSDVERAGGVFHDLFGGGSLAAADDVSFPVPCRFVTFAATAAPPLIGAVAALDVALVIHDGFALIGRVVAEALRLPRVNVYAGHGILPALTIPWLERQPKVAPAPVCLAAVVTLRDRYGIADASPFAYVGAPSRDLNIACEPPEFFTAEERDALAPVAFFGSLPGTERPRSDASRAPAASPHAPAFPGAKRVRLYASFGTVVWRWYPDEVQSALLAIARAVQARGDTTLLISLAGVRVDPAFRNALQGEDVRVVDFVDQRHVLGEAHGFVSHCGLNSVHEAIWHRVPILAYPFLWDQPALADICVRAGVAIPIGSKPLAPLAIADVDATLDRLEENTQQLRTALERARVWEEAVIAQRPDVIRAIAAFASGSAG
ncbi:MAG: glycosyltransferase [Casimicrobiaceae bacterium]